MNAAGIAVTAILLLVTIAYVASVQRSRAVSPELEAAGDAAVERARADVEKFGWHFLLISGEGSPGFLYTIGLWETYKHPEIILFAPEEDPRGMAGRLTAIVKQVEAGTVFEDGKEYPEMFGKYSGAVRRVHPQWYIPFLGTAAAVYMSFDFPAVQVFWPDADGRFPWKSGFNPELFSLQPILSESNVVLANVGYDVAELLVKEEVLPSIEPSLDELFVEADASGMRAVFEEWRWLVGPDAEWLRVTVFGDVFFRTPDGHVHFLDTGMGTQEEIAESEEAWPSVVVSNPSWFFHASTLLELRAKGRSLESDQVYSWRQSPMLGGTESVENLLRLSASVHVSHQGRLVFALKDVPPGSEVTISAESISKSLESMWGTGDDDLFDVVVNADGDYSMFPTGRDVPSSWKRVGKTGNSQECLDYIEEMMDGKKSP